MLGPPPLRAPHPTPSGHPTKKKCGQMRSGQIRSTKIGQMRPGKFGQMWSWPNAVWPNKDGQIRFGQMRPRPDDPPEIDPRLSRMSTSCPPVDLRETPNNSGASQPDVSQNVTVAQCVVPNGKVVRGTQTCRWGKVLCYDDCQVVTSSGPQSLNLSRYIWSPPAQCRGRKAATLRRPH